MTSMVVSYWTASLIFSEPKQLVTSYPSLDELNRAPRLLYMPEISREHYCEPERLRRQNANSARLFDGSSAGAGVPGCDANSSGKSCCGGIRIVTIVPESN